jgi:hypothetical protein
MSRLILRFAIGAKQDHEGWDLLDLDGPQNAVILYVQLLDSSADRLLSPAHESFLTLLFFNKTTRAFAAGLADMHGGPTGAYAGVERSVVR